MHKRNTSAVARPKQQVALRSRTDQTSVVEGQKHLAGEVPRPKKRGIGDPDGSGVDGDGNGDGGEGNPGYKSSRRRRYSETKDRPPRWACPFWKHDPLHNVACSSYTLKRVRDVKQHLLRKHRRWCLYCPTCRREFTTTQQRDIHITERNCHAEDSTTCSGTAESATCIATEKEEKLRGRMTGQDDEIWYRMWNILFEDASKPPSPHQGNMIEEVAGILQAFWAQHHQEIVSDVINDLGCSEASVVQEHLPRLMSTALGQLVSRLTQVTHGISDSRPSSPVRSKVPASDPNISSLSNFSLATSLEPSESTSIGMGGLKDDDFFGSWLSTDSALLYGEFDLAEGTEPYPLAIDCPSLP